MNAFNNLAISKKFAVGFAVVVAVVVAMCVSVFMSVTAIDGAVTKNDTSVTRLNAARQVYSTLLESQADVRGYIGSGNPQFLKEIAEDRATQEEAMSALEKLDPADAEKLKVLREKIAELGAQEDELIAQARDPAQRGAAAARLATFARLKASREALKAYTDGEDAELKIHSKQQDDTQAVARTVLIAGGVVATLLAAAMGWLLSAAIARPIGAMTQAMGRLAAGDNTVAIPAVGRKDEVGLMADAVQTFKDAAIEKAQMEKERAAAAAEQARVVDSVATGLERLAKGVLTFRLGDAFPAAYEKLRADFNAAIGQMQDVMREVAVNATGVRSGAGEISQASDNLSRRTEQQAASLEETAAALDEITATVKKTAEGAGQARDAVGAARADAERSGVVVRDAVSAMSEIEGSAQQISQIIGVIDEIAFQTNLLALNAGVEAARAGDAGRGFAVVASEVRALAQRSADAAKEIKALISASSQQVDRGVSLVGETGKVLERILTQVTQINGVVTDIAASAQEQATGLQQVNTAVNQMDQVTQQNAAMVEEATAASHALATEAEALARLIARFELGQTADAPMTVHAPAPVQRTVTQMKTTAVRGGGAAALAVTAEESWDEF